MFGYTLGANIKNLKLTNSSIIGGVLVGGIVGSCGGTTIENCMIDSTTTIKGVRKNQYGTYVGGIVGNDEASKIIDRKVSIIKCINKGTVYGVDQYVGGIIGVLTANIEECINVGNVSGGAADVGGIAGYIFGTGNIKNSYSIGDVSGSVTGTLFGTFLRYL